MLVLYVTGGAISGGSYFQNLTHRNAQREFSVYDSCTF